MMNFSRRAGWLLALASLLITAGLPAQEPASAPAEQARPEIPEESPAELEAKSRQAYAEGDYVQFYVANMKLHERFPFVPQYLYDIVRACALVERPNTAYHYMLKMQQQGLAYDFNETEDSMNIRGNQAYDYINNLMIEAGMPSGDASVAMRVEGDPVDFDGLAWDSSREAFLLGTAGQGRLLAVSENGEVRELLRADDANGLWSINGVAVDAARNRLWIASTATPRFEGYSAAVAGRAALFELDLASLEVLDRHHVPVDGLHHELGSVAVTGDGHVYVIDTVMPVVYRKIHGAPGLHAFVGSAEMVVFSDLAVTPDNSRLFLADPIRGVLVVDPVAQQVGLLSGPETLNLGGITGVEYADGKLYVVQSGIRPERVMRLQLDQSGYAVTESAPMAIAIEEFDRPGYGALRGDSLFYFANQGGEKNPREAVVMRTALDANAGTKVDIDQLRKVLQPSES